MILNSKSNIYIYIVNLKLSNDTQIVSILILKHKIKNVKMSMIDLLFFMYKIKYPEF